MGGHCHGRWCSEVSVDAVGLSTLSGYAIGTESGIDHAVQDSDIDGGLGPLTGQLAGMQVVAEDVLVLCHRGFRLGPLAIAGLPLPTQPTRLGNALDMAIALGRFGG
jgi:hypothetical protein